MMAVYLFTYHAHGSWLPDRKHGFVVKGKGVQPPNRNLARIYRARTKQKPGACELSIHTELVRAARNICTDKGWRLHQVQVNSSHIHLLVSWREFIDWKRVSNSLKRGLGIEVSKALNRKGPWFSRGSSRKRVREKRHF